MKGLVFLLAHIAITSSVNSTEIRVKPGQDLNRAIQAAGPGDVITLAPGRYEISRIRLENAGLPDRPITVRAAKLGEARIESRGVVGFHVRAAHWHFENLDVIGQCERENHSNCEHAFHLTGDADGVVIKNSRLVNFNAAIKANGDGAREGTRFPDDVLVSGTMIYNTESRQTRNPVTPIDVVGGRRWRVEDNFLADYGRADGIASYQGFLKGNSKDAVVVGNLAICNWRHSSLGRVGLSLGGGGTTNNALCEDKNCDIEHENGAVIGNIVANCPSEPGLYINAAVNSRVSGNLLFKTTGIQLHTQFASADIHGNILNGGVRDRAGSQHTEYANEVYGIRYATFAPAVSAYVQRRLEGQDKKFPSIISPGMVKTAKDIVAGIFDLIIRSPLGLGYGGMEDDVTDHANLNLALKSPQSFRQSGLTYLDTDTDFCGRSRAGDTVAGPFVGDEAPCDPSDRIRRVLDLEREFPIR
jgi:hypothetical protein